MVDISILTTWNLFNWNIKSDSSINLWSKDTVKSNLAEHIDDNTYIYYIIFLVM